ncbi:Oidioi.mRNA.OKI2018_I69.chr1.g2787.t1.cds [Oikopleura dioica]|uniref:Oidioi.mRNA.OKI2018_I69.chr1.g2787.t1.cds n=1 Tax=Oikopleura dioica TaxID=34765 RepID=A0ABN7SWH6_OIKDI|nr:Oidioi.mRNA.OKI2018_I69.chr1.g2787.t1.cds [Oikopleura dioica]
MRLFQLSRRLLCQNLKITKHVRTVKSQGFYSKFDKDGDGEISPAEFKKIMESSEYGDVYKHFDDDGDGNITPEELISILVKLGEVPMDLALYFNDMSSSSSTEFAGVVNFLTILTNYCSMKNPAKVEQEVLQDLEQFAEGSETINKDQLQDWLFKIHPEFDDDLLDALAEGADLDGDDEINYIAYVQLVTRQILKLRKVKENLIEAFLLLLHFSMTEKIFSKVPKSVYGGYNFKTNRG